MHLADSKEQARRDIRYGAEEWIRYLNNNQPRMPVPEGADYVDWAIEHEIAVVGTPEDAIARIERLYERQGDFGAVLLQITNWADWPALKRSLELYAQYVIPHFAGANENRQASYAWVTKNQDELVTKRVNAAQQMFARHEAEQAAKSTGAERPEAVNAPTLS
jgi:limonene 1,2-monooxygenase